MADARELSARRLIPSLETLDAALNSHHTGLDPVALSKTAQAFVNAHPHGTLPDWFAEHDAALAAIGTGHRASLSLDDRVCIDIEPPLDEAQQAQFRQHLLALRPWRKGPFRIGRVDIDAEWRSDFKWARVQPLLAPLNGRRVLDVGCGNGWFMWPLHLEGAAAVVGIDPGHLFGVQFQVCRSLVGQRAPIWLPLTLEALLASNHAPTAAFDTVLSMGVLYHRRNPFAHLEQLKTCLAPGGQLLLETLVDSEAGEGVSTVPGRYARMPNVHHLPGPEALTNWIRRCGFENVKLDMLTETDISEQRSTVWMEGPSLIDALDPNKPSHTREGLPRPMRAICTAWRGNDR